LHTDADWPVATVGALGFRHRVVVDVDDFVEVLGDNLGDFLQLLNLDTHLAYNDPLTDSRRIGDLKVEMWFPARVAGLRQHDEATD